MTEYVRMMGELDRISCFLAGEIEVPDDVPGWRVLCHSPSRSSEYAPTLPDTYTELVSRPAGASTSKRHGSDYESNRAEKRKRLGCYNRSVSDIRVPLVWETCLLTLWEHAIRHSVPTTVQCKEVFVERIRRISSLAIRSLQQRGFFTLKHLLGVSRATKIHEWARDKWIKRPDLFRPGKLSGADPGGSKTIRTDLVAWFCTDEFTHDESTDDGIHEVKLLFLYLDAIVRAMAPYLVTRTGLPGKIDSRSWAALSVYKRHSSSIEEPIGYVAHYDNPEELSDGRLLSIMYYLNPQWESSWGGNLILWPPGVTVSKSQTLCGSNPDNVKNCTSHTLSLAPTLDRLVLFYADERTLHLVQPVLPSSTVDERIAIVNWYFDTVERTEFKNRQERN
ncbi:unnamed protein product [Dicrocoelium dendriticum]|nr:unnamed protein product [Dicrocoelium dendriticum]